jgi:predicted HTH transcriptional regulator
VKVIRAALGLGNLRYGGHIVIGIDDADLAAMAPGLSDEQLATWMAFDDVSRKMAEYADPPLRFDIAHVELSNGATVAVIQVFEFEDIPHLCKKDYPDVLRNGAMYVRPRRVPETSEVGTSVEMREVLELATEKALQNFVATAGRAGVALTAAPVTAADESETSRERYANELRRAWDE